MEVAAQINDRKEQTIQRQYMDENKTSTRRRLAHAYLEVHRTYSGRERGRGCSKSIGPSQDPEQMVTPVRKEIILFNR